MDHIIIIFKHVHTIHFHLRSEQVAIGSKISDQLYSASGGNATYEQRSIPPYIIEQVAISSQMPAQHYLPSPGGAAYMMPHGPMYSQAAATPGLLPQCEFITPFVCSCNIAFKSLAGVSSFTYGHQPPHLTPSTSSWPQSKSTMHACRIFSKVYNII